MASEQPRGIRRKRRSSATGIDVSQHVNGAGMLADGQTLGPKRAKRPKRASSQQSEREISSSQNIADEVPSAREIEDEVVVEPCEHPQSGHAQVETPSLSITTPDTLSPIKLTNFAASPQHDGHSQSRRRSGSSFIREGTDGSTVEVVQFKPYTEQLDERMKHRLRRSHLSEAMNAVDAHEKQDRRTRQELQELKVQMEDKNKRIEELRQELERRSARASQMSEEDHVKIGDMEAELTTLREEVAEQQRIADVNDSLSIVDADVGMEDTSFAPAEIDGGINSIDYDPAALQEASRPVTYPELKVPDPTADVEAKLFEQVITSKSREIADLTAKLQVYTTEIQALGFGPVDSDPLDVLSAARATFRHARAKVEAVFPELQTSKHQNGRLVSALTDEIAALVDALKNETSLLQQAKEHATALTAKLDRRSEALAATEHRKKELETLFSNMDRLADQRLTQIVDLEDEIADLRNEFEELMVLHNEHLAKIDELAEDVAMKDADKAKLQQALGRVLKELEKETELLKKLDQDYNDQLASAKREHTQHVSDLEKKLKEQTSARNAAELDTAEKATLIDSLENDLQEANDTIAELQALLQAAQNDTTEQQARGNALDNELGQRIAEVTELQIMLEKAGNDHDNLSSDVDRLKNLVEMERGQRESAEAELDSRNSDIEVLHERLRDTGQHANELKSKLFEAQERRKQEIAALEQQAAQRQVELQGDLDGECNARAALADQVEELNGVIADMEDQIRETEDTSERITAEKDKLLFQGTGRIKELESLLEEHDKRHQKFAEDKGKEIQGLRDNINNLDKDLVTREKNIKSLEKEMADEREKDQEIIDNHANHVSELQDNVRAMQDEIATLERDKASLERRVENMSIELLNTQNDYADNIQALNNAIVNRDKALGALSLEKQDIENKYVNDIRAKEDVITSLKGIVATRGDEVDSLHAHVHDLEHENEVTKRKAMDSMVRMRRRIAAATAENDQEQERFEQEMGLGVLDSGLGTPNSPAVQNAEVDTPHTSRRSKRVAEKTVKKKESRRVSVDDSAFFEMEDVEVDEAMHVVTA